MMVTAKDLEGLGIADIILPEPNGGNHLNYDDAAKTLKAAIIDSIKVQSLIKPGDRIQKRIEKYEKMGRWRDG